MEEDTGTVIETALNASTVGSAAIQRQNASPKEEGRKVKGHEEKGRRSQRSWTQKPWLLAQIQPLV